MLLGWGKLVIEGAPLGAPPQINSWECALVGLGYTDTDRQLEEAAAFFFSLTRDSGAPFFCVYPVCRVYLCVELFQCQLTL